LKFGELGSDGRGKIIVASVELWVRSEWSGNVGAGKVEIVGIVGVDGNGGCFLI
jgi:hypothetical protein